MKSQVATAETYGEVERLVYHTVNRFIYRYGGDFEEYVGEANIIFMKCVAGFRPKCAKFSTYLVNAIWNRLVTCRNAAHKEQALRIVSLDDSAMTHSGTTAGEVEDYRTGRYDFSDLTYDAQTVISLVYDAPAEIQAALTLEGRNPQTWRESICDYLHGLGWDGLRIADSLMEVREALAG